jgi:hypothetical protein
MTSGNAGFATAAFVEVHLKGVLLAGCGRGGWKQATILLCLRSELAAVMRAGESFHRRQRLLVVQQRVN